MDAAATPWVVCVGASGSDGVGDLVQLLGGINAPLNAVFLIVLHRPMDRPTHLQSILARASALPVVIPAHGETLVAGRVYIGEPSRHLTCAADWAAGLVDDQHNGYAGRTVDLLFNSVAAHAANRMIGVILSGSLDDGSRGLAAIHAAGGVTMVLAPVANGWNGMPENAIKYDGPVNVIGPLPMIAQAICAICAADRPLDRIRSEVR